MDVLATADPIWNGVTLTPGTPPTIDILSATNRTLFNLNGPTFLPGITSVAALTGNNSIVGIAYAAPGTFGVGSAAQYYIAGMSGNDGEGPGFTAEGNQVFLNAIDVLTIPEPSAALFSSLGLLALLRRRRRA